MASKAGGVDEPLLPPAYPVTATNRGAYVLLTAVIMITLSGVVIALKLQVRTNAWTSPLELWDIIWQSILECAEHLLTATDDNLDIPKVPA